MLGFDLVAVEEDDGGNESMSWRSIGAADQQIMRTNIACRRPDLIGGKEGKMGRPSEIRQWKKSCNGSDCLLRRSDLA